MRYIGQQEDPKMRMFDVEENTVYHNLLISPAMSNQYNGTKYPGADPGEVKWVNFHPPFSEPPFFFFLIPQILK